MKIELGIIIVLWAFTIQLQNTYPNVSKMKKTLKNSIASSEMTFTSSVIKELLQKAKCFSQSEYAKYTYEEIPEQHFPVEKNQFSLSIL